MILFFGDVHGRFGHVERAVDEHRPEAIILLGDIQAQRQLEKELAAILNKTEVWWIPGNHDTDSHADHDNLFNSALADRNLHGKVVEIDGLRVGGLGGVFRGEIWYPEHGDEAPNYESYDEYREKSLQGKSWMAANPEKPEAAKDPIVQGKLLKHRSTIFTQEYYELAAQEADILVTHEAPSCHPNGFVAIDELARSMRVQRSFHGHHHDNLDYQAKSTELGFNAYGVGLRGIVDMHGTVIKAGEQDEQRAYRQDRGE